MPTVPAIAFQMITKRVTLANALAQAGRGPAAAALFAEAEARQAEKREPEFPRLYSLQGYNYCDLLLARGAAQAVQERAAWVLPLMKQQRWLLDIGLFSLVDGSRASLLLAADGDVEATGATSPRLDEAVTALRAAGS